MSAFLGGVAQGFLQAKVRSEDAAAQAEKDRLERLEAQKDRQLRLDIADRQIEMQRQTLLNQQKSANDRRDIQLATPAYQEILKTIEANPRGALAANYSPTINAAVQKYFGLSVDKDGYYTSPTRYDEAQKARAQAAYEKLQPGLIKGMDAGEVPTDAIRMFMRRSGNYTEDQIKNPLEVRKVQNNITKKHYNNINLVGLRAFRESTGTSGGEISYPSKINKHILVYARLPDINNFDQQNLPFLQNLTATTKDQLSRDPKNDNAFRHGRLGILEKHLRTILKNNPDGMNSDAFKAHAKEVRQRFRGDFLTAASIAKNQGHNEVSFRPNAQETIIQEINPHKAYPILKQIMGAKDNVPSSVNETRPLTMNEVNKRVAKTINKDATYVNNLQVSGKVNVENVPASIDGLVIDNQPGAFKENLVVPGQDNSDSVRITVTDDDASMSSEPMMIEETLADIIQYPNGSEVVNVGTFTPNSFKRYEKSFNRIMSLEGLGNLKEQYLAQEGLTNQYEMLKPVFKTRDAFFNNPTSKKTFNDFRNAVASAFNLTDPDTGVVDPKNLDYAMQKIVERQVKKEETGGFSSEVTTNPDGSLSIKKIRNTAENEKISIPYKKNLISENDKLKKTESDVLSFRQTSNLIGYIEEFEKGELNMEGEGAQILMQGLLDMPGLFGNNEANNALRQGMRVGTDATQFITSAIQKIRDYGVAFGTVFRDATGFASRPPGLEFMGVSPKTLTAFKNSKRGYDYANNSVTASRLRDVEDLIPKEAKQYEDKANELIEKAQKASTTEESVRLKMGAFRNYLLAKNLMTKVTLTYNYAGMVQGESGGRAISNEDFAILFKAIWGTAGGDKALGSFNRLEETIAYLKERNENSIKYAEFKNGQNIANRMQKLNRILRRQSPLSGSAAKEAESFSLRRFLAGQPQQSADVSDAIDRAYYPANVLPKIQDGNIFSDYKNELSIQSQHKIKVRFFRDVAKNVFDALPAKKSVRGKTTKSVRLANYNRLKASEKSAVLNAGKQALVKLIYENGTFYEDPFNNLNKYGTSNIRLGNAISNMYKFRTGVQNNNYTTDEQNFINSLIKDLYNNQPPKRAK